MRKSIGRILTTHAGSLVRPPEIIEAMMAADLGHDFDRAAYAADLRRSVGEVVAKQIEIGIDVVDDGEFGKVNWIAYVTERMTGLELRTRGRTEALAQARWPEPERFGDFYHVYQGFECAQWLPETRSKAEYVSRGAAFQVAICTGPVSYKPQALARDLDNLKAALAGAGATEAFVPVAAPCSIEYMPNRHYAKQDDYLFALADALAVEYRMIIDAGFLLQVDDAILPMQYFMRFRDQGLAAYKDWARVRVEALNRALNGIPPKKIRYHVCFGSQNIPHTTDPALRDIIDLVLAVNAQAYSIEACNPRHEHEWEIWRDVKLPDGKILVPGVVNHTSNIVEHPELVAQRLRNFAGLVGRENVIAGTDCGFSQGWNSIRVHPQIQWAKLEALVEGARLASTRLWP